MLASIMPPMSNRIVPFWEEDSCHWLDGHITEKYMQNEGLVTAEYIFVVNGTVDNYTDLQITIYGTALHYQFFQVGDYYNGTICDTLSLREAISEGVIRFLF